MMNIMTQNLINSQMHNIFDPTKMDSRVKKMLIQQNITQSKIGLYKSYPKYKPVTCSFVGNYQPCVPSSICDVKVIYAHSIDVAEEYAEKGLQISNENKMNPVVLNLVGKDFSGTNFESNEDIRDEIINLRTSFNDTLGTQIPYPVKETDCVYAKSVTVIRQKQPQMGFLSYPQTFRFAMITTSPITKPKLISNDRMNAIDYVKTCTTIECVFQVAIAGNHHVLILSPFGYDDANPIDDVIKIYNYCIFKYGHKFKHIIIAIPPHYPKDVFENYNKNIVNLHNLVADVDSKYDKLDMEKKFKNHMNDDAAPLDPPLQQPLQQQNSQQPSTQQQMQQMITMMQQNPTMMQQMMQQMLMQQQNNYNQPTMTMPTTVINK